jgi:hypothetical protein
MYGGEACYDDPGLANECEEPKDDTEGLHLAPAAAAIGDDEDYDSFEAKCKELFEPAVDPVQLERQGNWQKTKMLKKAMRLHKKEAIGYGPIRTASSLVGATYDSQAVVPYGATKAIVSQRATSSGTGRDWPIGKPPP